MFQRIVSIICKDVRNENESKNMIVSLRVVLLLVLANILVVEAVSALNNLFFLAAASLIFLALFTCCFAVTYKFGTLFAYYCFSGTMVLWVAFSVFNVGWQSEAQLLVLLLLAMRFFEAYSRLRTKLIFAASLCAYTLMLYIFSLEATTTVDSHGLPITLEVTVFITVLNLIVAFGGMTVVCWLFGSETLRDEEKLVLYNRRLQHDASTDTLTGLPNRRKMIHDIEDSIKRVKTQQQEIFSVAIGDIDHFKKVNDTMGHDCGDVVLQELSKLFSQFIKTKGKVARWGGEEFLFIFDNMNGDQALIELHALVDEIRNLPIEYKKDSLKVTMTFGLEEYDIHSTLEENTKNADKKLYLGKSSGRNTIIY